MKPEPPNPTLPSLVRCFSCCAAATWSSYCTVSASDADATLAATSSLTEPPVGVLWELGFPWGPFCFGESPEDDIEQESLLVLAVALWGFAEDPLSLESIEP